MASSKSNPSALFQPTPLHEERRNVGSGFSSMADFNPRPCTRSDEESPAKGADEQYLNPRPCTRSDYPYVDIKNLTVFSTHAPARGATG